MTFKVTNNNEHNKILSSQSLKEEKEDGGIEAGYMAQLLYSLENSYSEMWVREF